MAENTSTSGDLKYDRLSLIALGGQSEVGQVLWALSLAGEILLIDAGACYPGTDLPGVDLLLPNCNFLQANQERITALLLTNGHEEHCGAVAYLLSHLKIPRILAPRFVSELVLQNLLAAKIQNGYESVLDTVTTRHPYQIGAFEVEWIQVNDAIADACALKINTPEGVIIYTSSFKLDQTPVDNRLMDVAHLASAGDAGVLLLLSDSAGVENQGYTPSEKVVLPGFERHIAGAQGRVIVDMDGTNTHRLQMLFDLALHVNRKVVLCGDTLIQTAVAAVITGNLHYDRSIESTLADLDKLEDKDVLIVATGTDGDALELLWELAHGKNRDLTLKRGDTVIFSAELYPGSSRKMATILDQLLSSGVRAVTGDKEGVHVSSHASQEELKLILSITKPRFFVPALGEGRHIMHHAQLAREFGLSEESIFPLRNGEILEIGNGSAAVVGSVEAQAVLFNRDQGESVTTFSVNERRVLSTEGVLTIGCLITASWELAGKPALAGAALGFMHSADWEAVEAELLTALAETVARQKETEGSDLNSLKSALRDVAAKMIRSRLQSKPTIHVVVHELSATRPG